MSFDLPTPDVLTERYASAMEAIPFTAPDGTVAYVDAHTPNSIEAVLARTHGMSLYEGYLFLAYICREMFPDSAVDNLYRWGAIYAVPRNPPVAAVGNGTLAITGPAQIPAGTEAQDGSGNRVTVTATVAASAAGTVTVNLVAEVAGTAANMDGGTVLTLTSPAANVSNQQITLDANGLAGGEDIEEIESWRSRIVAEIQSAPGAGRSADYVKWATAAGAAYVAVYRGWQGERTVGVVVVMAGPVVATPAEIATIQAYIDARRPVATTVIVVAGSLAPVPFQLALSPDTTDGRTAASALLQAAFTARAAIGLPWYQDASWTALSGIPGLISRRIAHPVGDVAMTTSQLPTLGPVSFVDPY